jgi:Yip1 domain
MSLINRAKNILLTPNTEWDFVAKEPATVGGLFTGYAIPLSVLPVIGSVVATGLLGIGMGALGGLGMSFVLGSAAVGFAAGLIMLFLMSFLVNAISPSFNGKSDTVSATKLMTYASTPSWVGGLFAPFLGSAALVVSIAAIAYVVYLIYTGARSVMEVPAEKVAGFTVVTILIYIVLLIVVSIIIGVIALALFGGAMMAAAAGA